MEASLFEGRRHISTPFNDELHNIHGSVLRMGGMVQQQLDDALDALANMDGILAEEVVARDQTVNRLEIFIDNLCRQVLVRRQPTAGDLRLVLSSIKTITDLERIGDEAKRIARMTLRHADEQTDQKRPVDISHLSDQVQNNLRRALDTFARMDAGSALRILVGEDQPVDQEYNRVTRQLVTAMMNHPERIPLCLDILWSSRALERISDRACNICEYVIYYVHGKDVRYSNLRNSTEIGEEAPDLPT